MAAGGRRPRPGVGGGEAREGERAEQQAEVAQRLHHDLTNCVGNGLVIGADNIKLNLDGHTIDGNDQGIASSGGADNDDFAGNRVSHNLGGAIAADDGTGNRVRENLIADNGDGITVGLARETEITSWSAAAAPPSS